MIRISRIFLMLLVSLTFSTTLFAKNQADPAQLKAEVEKIKLSALNLFKEYLALPNDGHNAADIAKLSAWVQLLVSDILQDNLDYVVSRFGATFVPTDKILSVKADVLSPCALGAILNDDTIANLKTTIIAGGANNQLASDQHGKTLMKKGVLYAPDYVINAGGIINVCGETTGNYDVNWVNKKVDDIYHTLLHIYERSNLENRPTNIVADELAEEIMTEGKKSAA